MSLDLPPADERVARRPSVATAICQIGFDEQPRIAEGAFAIEFHERLGGPGGRYSKLEQAEERVVEVSPTGPQQRSRRVWSLEAGDGSWSIALLPDGVALQANNEGYGGWDDFAQRLTEVLEVLIGAISPSVENRIGLRFVDRIRGGLIGVEEASGWQPYISPEFLGPISIPGIGQAVEAGQQQLRIDAGNAATCQIRQGLALVTGEDRSVYVIDCDFFREGVRQFDQAAILETVGRFQEQADRVFAMAVTSKLLDVLVT